MNDLIKQFGDLLKRGSRKFTAIHQKRLEFIADKDNSMRVLLSENGDINFQKRFFKKMIDRTRKLIDDALDNQADQYIHEGYSIFIIHDTIGLIQYWLKNNMHIPISTLAKMLDTLTTIGGGIAASPPFIYCGETAAHYVYISYGRGGKSSGGMDAAWVDRLGQNNFCAIGAWVYFFKIEGGIAHNVSAVDDVWAGETWEGS